MNTRERKKRVKSEECGNSCSAVQASPMKVAKKVAKKSSRCVVKEESNADVVTASKKNHRHLTDVEISGAVDDSGSFNKKLPSRKRKISVTNDESVQKVERSRESVKKRPVVEKKLNPTRSRKLAKEAQKKKVDEEQPEREVGADKKSSGKVKSEAVDRSRSVGETCVKTEKPDVTCTMSPASQHSCRKFIGAHMSIAGIYSLT